MNPTTMRRLSGSPGCVVCDNNESNPRSLRVPLFWNEEDGSLRIPFVPDEHWCGYSRVVHGGVIASVLDEAMSWCVKETTGEWAFTVDCRIRFKAPVLPGKEYTAIGLVTESLSRKILTEGRIVDAEGKIAAIAEGVFIPVKGRAETRSE